MREHDINDSGLDPAETQPLAPALRGEPCPECGGDGTLADGGLCPSCGGSGRVTEGAESA